MFLNKINSYKIPCGQIISNFKGYFCAENHLQIGYKVIKDNKIFTLRSLPNDSKGKMAIINMGRTIDIPYIANLVDQVSLNEEIWYIMEYNSENSLRKQMNSKNYDIQDLVKDVDLFDKIFQGLHGLHKAGFVHSNLTPSSIQIDDQGNPVIADLQYLVLNGAKKHPLIPLNYISPEGLKSAIEGIHAIYRPEMNYYSYGVIFYEYLKKKPPIVLIYPSYTSQLLSPITFGSLDNEDIFHFLFSILKPRSKRAEYMELQYLLNRMKLGLTNRPLKRNFTYNMRQYIGKGEESCLGKILKRNYEDLYWYLTIFTVCLLFASILSTYKQPISKLYKKIKSQLKKDN
jgi:serine/threonine protein kinase